MRAMVCTNYGPPEVLQLQEVAKPAPKDHEILVRIHATTVTSGDCRVRSFNSPLLMWIPMRLVLGLRRPRKPILGVELAGVVEAVGRNVKRFRAGDRVYAMTGMNFGGYAEYVCLPENGLVAAMPAQATYEEAAAVLFGGTTALHFYRKGRLREGQKVLVYGASGAVGTSAVQLAKIFGAEVTAVCGPANQDFVKSLGADRVMDYTKGDYASGQERYDLIFDAVGKTSKARCKPALAPNGTYVSVVGQGIAKVLPEDLTQLRELMEAGKLRAVIGRSYPLERIPEAHRYVEEGHKRGNVVITV
ncbi:NAD(P)-dependent alcohol dehydrogenase [Gorillibacterium sp. sgz5001074]|uniref:NAD(P)-dependent alcohol dehydrogenase n=1 Tax=Gorillibacterium sp. sgz5001074 TaxID=3446695 RepID=UPI003F661B8F